MNDQTRLALVQQHRITTTLGFFGMRHVRCTTCGVVENWCPDEAAANRAAVGHLVKVQAEAEGH